MVVPSIITALWRQRQEDQEFEDSPGYIERPYLKKKMYIEMEEGVTAFEMVTLNLP
jgi:hypothetical protein